MVEKISRKTWKNVAVICKMHDLISNELMIDATI